MNLLERLAVFSTLLVLPVAAFAQTNPFVFVSATPVATQWNFGVARTTISPQYEVRLRYTGTAIRVSAGLGQIGSTSFGLSASVVLPDVPSPSGMTSRTTDIVVGSCISTGATECDLVAGNEVVIHYRVEMPAWDDCFPPTAAPACTVFPGDAYQQRTSVAMWRKKGIWGGAFLPVPVSIFVAAQQGTARFGIGNADIDGIPIPQSTTLKAYVTKPTPLGPKVAAPDSAINCRLAFSGRGADYCTSY